jgi:hypothetical protein
MLYRHAIIAFGILGAFTLSACNPKQPVTVPEEEASLDPGIALEAPANVASGRATYRLVNRTSKLCLGVQAASRLDLARITQTKCGLTESGLWQLSPVSDDPNDKGFYRLIAQHSGKALGMSQSGTVQSGPAQAAAIQSPYIAHHDQQWALQPVANSSYLRLFNRDSGLPLALPACSRNIEDQAQESQPIQDGKCAEFSQEFGFSSVAQVATPAVGFKQKDFVIGTYIGPALTTYAPNRYDFLPGDLNEDRRRFADVKAAGFNLLLKSFKLILPKEQTMRELSLAAEFNLKYLINDNRIDIPSLGDAPADPVVTKAVTNDFKNLPANLNDTVYGYDLGDEPRRAFPSLKDWVQHIKSNDPSKLAYTNLLPRHGLPSDQAYLDYVDSFYPLGADRSQIPDVISYDYYPLLKTSALNHYFENMRLISGRAKALGISFWTYPISVQDNANYRVIDPQYLRLQAFAPIAYGANGLIYYTYGTFEFCNDVFTATSCETSSNGSYVRFLGEAMIGIDHKTKTPIYGWAQEINRYLRDVVGPAVMRSEHLGVYHNSDYTYEGYGVNEAIPAGERITSSTPVIEGFSDAKFNSMIGIFRDKIDSSLYLLVVNRAYQGESLDVTLNLRGNLTGRVFETSMAHPELQAMASQVVDSSTRVVVRSLAPGEGRLIKLIMP